MMKRIVHCTNAMTGDVVISTVDSSALAQYSLETLGPLVHVGNAAVTIKADCDSDEDNIAN